MIAEFSLTAAPFAVDLELQWGRDQLIAELLLEELTWPGITQASMGPRSIDRGISVSRLRTAAPSALQWGRDQLIAEFVRLTWYWRSASWLQWGRDQLIAEFGAYPCVHPFTDAGFNGAAIN